MNKTYLKSNVIQEIERAKYLKGLIKRPTPYPELIGLEDRCSRGLDENIGRLEALLKDLDSSSEVGDIRVLYRYFRHLYWNVKRIEYFGIPALHFQNEDVRFLNKLIFKIQQELSLPYIAPSIACFSNKYFWIEGATNVIFIPIGEVSSVLHLPDLFHELGHATICHKDNDPKLEGIKLTYQNIVDNITEYYQKEINIRARQTGPPQIPLMLEHLHSQWKERWIDEFFSDLFACYTIGPAYAWAHLHLTAKRWDDVYHLEQYPIPQSHPSDDSRMQILIMGLKLLGYHSDADDILRIWENMPFVTSSAPVHEYQFAYPRELLENIARLMLEGMRNSGFSILTPNILQNLNDSSVRKNLNDAWREFWNNPDYIEWEKGLLSELKKNI